MIRFLLALLVVFLLLVAFQDAPPVARLLESCPPGVAAALRDARVRIMGHPHTSEAIASHSAAGAAAGEFGRFFRQIEVDARALWQTLTAHVDQLGHAKPPARPEPTLPPSPER